MKVLYAYQQSSKGCKALAEAMDIRRVKHNGSRVVGSRDLKLLNWGAGSLPEALTRNGTQVFNTPDRINSVSNKRSAFRLLSGACRMPEFTSELTVARGWASHGKMVVARTVLNGHSGAGIVLMDPDHPDTWEVRADLYTKYVKKQDEYRIHICRGEIIDRQRKGLKEEFRGRADNNFYVRNLANGFVYVRNDIQIPADVGLQAVRAMVASGLDYGAVDVLWNRGEAQAYVLEINSAPGLTGTTVDNWARALGAL